MPCRVAAVEINSNYITINHGWYIQTHSEPTWQLTPRLYGSFKDKLVNHRAINIASFRCERSKSPYLRVLLPKKISDAFRKKRRGSNYFFLEKIVFKGKNDDSSWVAWFNENIDALTINFIDKTHNSIEKRNKLISLMQSDFKIVFPIIGYQEIKYKYVPMDIALKEMQYIAESFGTEFVYDRKLEFLNVCDKL